MVESPRRWLRPFFLAGLVAVGGVSAWVYRTAPRVSAHDGMGRKEKTAVAGTAVGVVAATKLEGPSATEMPSAPEFAAGALLADVPLADAERARLGAALPAPARAARYVRVNTALVTGKASPFWRRAGEGRVVLPLDDGSTLTVVIDRSEMLDADRFTSEGHVEGRPGSRAVFAFNAGFLHADVDDPGRGNLVLRVATAGVSQFYRIDPALVPPCGGQRRTIIDGAVLAAAAERRARAGASAAGGAGVPTPAAENASGAEVHVMMAVTQDVLPTLAGAERIAALTSAFDAAMARTNSALSASLITARVRLVKVATTNYNELQSASNKVNDDALTALQSSTDGQMDELHALRDQCGADIVCLALNRRDVTSGGLAFVIDTPGDTTNALFAFSVVQYASVAGTNVVAHELGHTFGCAHDRENAFSPGAYAYSYGYRFFGNDGQRYHDIMSYPPGIELNYFSNPTVIAPAPVGVPVGIAAGLPGESDGARTIAQAAYEVSGYRLQTQAAPAAGTLINVATRATVAAGDRVVIAGFTVAGPQPKTILLRAAGPALAGFGVRDALAAPALELYAGGTRLAENAGWSALANAPAIAAAATSAGAFAFAPGSADAALLATLPPGGYTAIVRDAAGTATGSVLVEAYETAPGASRLINLATRAYADRQASSLVAGFVIRGAPGGTKRVLVRVRGPSLARAPFNVSDAMDDPLMEIHGAAGELILRNDDWSTGDQGGSSRANDFAPLVTYYNEQQIAATGLAPANRREPCLLMDLAPGNYTVVVLPFESLPDRPASPGVALVEVFEIGVPPGN